MKDLRPIRGQAFLSRAVAQGEHTTQDFKYAISDAHKIAHSISAFANNAGGRLLIGVKDNGTLAGIRTDEDIYLVEQAASMYCHPPQHLTFTAYKTDGARAIIVSAQVEPYQGRGVVCIEADGSRQAYFRIHDENIAVTPLMLECWRARRSPQALSVSGLDAERQILSTLHTRGPLLPDALYSAVKLSHTSFRDAIIRLYAMELVEFTFINRKFHLTII